MDAEWFAGARPKRKQRSDKGSLKRKATDGRFDVMPQYVDMGDLDDVGGNPAVDDPNRNFQDIDGACSSSAGCADQRPEADTRMDSPDRSMPTSQEEMDEAETSSSGRAPEQRRPGSSHWQARGVRHHPASHPAKPIADLHELTSKQIMDRARKHLERNGGLRRRTQSGRRLSGAGTCPRRRCFCKLRSPGTSHISTAQAATRRSRRRTPGDDIRKSCLSGRFANRAQCSQRFWRGLECSHRHCLWIRRTHSARSSGTKRGLSSWLKNGARLASRTSKSRRMKTTMTTWAWAWISCAQRHSSACSTSKTAACAG